MLSKSKGSQLLFILALSTGATGCYVTQPQPDEICNYLDDDGDGVIDNDFIDSNGIYHTAGNCGGCGINCDQVFPSALETTCVPDQEDANSQHHCEITKCPDGSHLLYEIQACLPDFSPQCMPCEDDMDCMLGDPDTRCVELPDGDTRCALPCDVGDELCDNGFACVDTVAAGETLPFCVPYSQSCECLPANEGAVFGCWLSSPAEDLKCPGEQICDGYSLSECQPQLEDICDGQDNNCNGEVDEDFMEAGHYVNDDHCGACNNPCVPPASNMIGECVLLAEATCLYECLDGFVDVDGVALNGCECEMTTIDWPPFALGGDGNCDGIIDDLSGFIFVSKDGLDSNPGTLEEPVLTMGQGITLATPATKTVFVSQGTYDEEVHLTSGVSMYGGYRSDFKERDTVIFSTNIEHSSGQAGHPILLADCITTDTEFAGFTVTGSDAVVPGAGSTTVLISNCGNQLSLKELTVHAGAGEDGLDGQSSSAILVDLGVTSPSQLDGNSGTNGGGGIDSYTNNCIGQFVSGGNKGSKICPVSGTVVSGGDGGESSCPATGCVIGQPCGNAGCSDFTVGGICDFDAVYAAANPCMEAENGSGPGAGIAGALTYDAPTTIPGITFCDDNPTLRREGGPGEDGGDGSDGFGGFGYSDADGAFDNLTGIWTAGDGTDGTDGGDGGGAGGGTQGNGYDRLTGASSNYNDQLGGAGGGGGSGGCGAPGATAGGGGGGSIGIAVFLTPFNSGPNFEDVRVVPADPGDGGDGGVGASGGMPGAGGSGGPGNFWCARKGGKGGDGGRGGSGGGGGGGAGGSVSGFHIVPGAFGTATDYKLELMIDNNVDAMPAPGSGGSGGYSPGSPGSSGVTGSASAFRIYDPS